MVQSNCECHNWLIGNMPPSLQRSNEQHHNACSKEFKLVSLCSASPWCCHTSACMHCQCQRLRKHSVIVWMHTKMSERSTSQFARIPGCQILLWCHADQGLWSHAHSILQVCCCVNRGAETDPQLHGFFRIQHLQVSKCSSPSAMLQSMDMFVCFDCMRSSSLWGSFNRDRFWFATLVAKMRKSHWLFVGNLLSSGCTLRPCAQQRNSPLLAICLASLTVCNWLPMMCQNQCPCWTLCCQLIIVSEMQIILLLQCHWDQCNCWDCKCGQLHEGLGLGIICIAAIKFLNGHQFLIADAMRFLEILGDFVHLLLSCFGGDFWTKAEFFLDVPGAVVLVLALFFHSCLLLPLGFSSLAFAFLAW